MRRRARRRADAAACHVHARACAGGRGGGRGGDSFGGFVGYAPDREAAQGSAARPGQATKLPNAAESERCLRNVMDTVPEDIRVRGVPSPGSQPFTQRSLPQPTALHADRNYAPPELP